MRDHIIVCGLGQLGFRIVELLHSQGETLTIVSKDTRPTLRRTVEEWGAQYVEGDARVEQTLLAAEIETARAVLIVTQDDLLNVEIALDVQRLNPDAAIVLRLFDRFIADRIGRDLSTRSIYSPATLTAPVFIAAALGSEILRAFEIGAKNINIVRIPFEEQTPGVGETLEAFCERLEIIPLAAHWGADIPRQNSTHTSARGASAQAVTADTRLGARVNSPITARLERALAPGDEIVVAASGDVTERLRHGGYLAQKEEETTPVLSLRRRLTAWGRTSSKRLHELRRTWRTLPPSLRRASFGLVFLVLLSIGVFHFTLPSRPSWIDSFYFVVTIMTTVGFGDYNLQHAAPWLKLYGCLVMISSTALIAILFGMVTDIIVSRRVEQALGQRPIRVSNHVIVVSLGTVGAGVVEEMNRLGETVVAITRDTEHEAVPELQDRIPVIIGDANRSSVLTRANVMQARAIIVTSTDDLRNLRIAHQAEILNPNLRSVVRIFDTDLAVKLSEGLSIDTTVNLATTAAAAFAASALQPHVEQAFTLGDRLFLLRWMLPEEVHRAGFIGALIEELREEDCSIVLRRSGSGEYLQTWYAEPQDVVQRGDWLLLLEEYFPNRHQSGPPELETYADHTEL